jgi:hypothetical protein
MGNARLETECVIYSGTFTGRRYSSNFGGSQLQASRSYGTSSRSYGTSPRTRPETPLDSYRTSLGFPLSYRSAGRLLPESKRSTRER